MAVQRELTTLTSSLSELAARLTTLVEREASSLPPAAYQELVAAERTIGTLLRRLNRLSRSLS